MEPIKITRVAFKKLFTYPKLVSGEIGGLGIVRTNGKSEFTIHDILLFEQDVSGTHTELDESSVAKLIMQMMDEKKDPSELKLWWHSHANMKAYWSGTDHGTCDKFGLTAPWYVSIVVNKEGNYRMRLDVFKPFRLTIDSLTLEVVEDADDPFVDELRKEVAEKVSERFGRRSVFSTFAPTKGSDLYRDYVGDRIDEATNQGQAALFPGEEPIQLPDYLKPKKTITTAEWDDMVERERIQKKYFDETDETAATTETKRLESKDEDEVSKEPSWLRRYLGMASKGGK